MICVRELLKGSALPRLEVQMLLQHVLQVPRSWLIAHDDEALPSDAVAQFRRLEQDRLSGQPMAYLVGYREFMGHDFLVSPAVLIPRPDTELLVETALQYIKVSGLAAPRVVDLGTGTGAIAVSIALACPQAVVLATDISVPALSIARTNAQRLAARVDFHEGSWYDGLPDTQQFDLIVSNPPYIAVNDAHLSQGDLRFEPKGALTEGGNGLAALAAIVRGAAGHLAQGGALWVEHGWDQADNVRALLREAGFKQVSSQKDLAGIERISGGYL